MKIWATVLGTHRKGWVDIQFGQEVTVFRCGLGRSVFGEKAYLRRANSKNLIFITESGAEVKTKADSLGTVGKARKEGYCVSLYTIDTFDDIIHEKVRYWNNKTCEFEKR